MARAIEAAQAYFRFFADDKEFKKTIAAVSARMKAVAGSIASLGVKLGAAGVALGTPLLLATKNFAEAGDELDDLSKRTGVAASKLSYLAYAAQFSNVSMDQLSAALTKLGKKFAGSGVAIDEQLLRLADQIHNTVDPSLRLKVAMDHLGKSGAAMVPFLSQGRDEILRLKQEAEDLNVVMTDQQAALADELGDSWLKLKSVFQGIQNQIGSALAPALIKITETLSKAAGAISKLAQDNPRFIQGLAALSAALIGLGTAFPVIAGAIYLVSAGLAAMVYSINLLQFAFAALVSPIGLVSAALIALAVQMGVFRNISFAVFGQIFNSFKQMFSGIEGYLRSGDLEGAANLAIAGVKLAFATGMDLILVQWTSWKNAILTVFDDLSLRVASKVDEITTHIAKLITAMSSPEILGGPGVEAAGEIIKILDDDFNARERARLVEWASRGNARNDATLDEDNARVDELEKLRREYNALRAKAPYAGTPGASGATPPPPPPTAAVDAAGRSSNKGTFEGTRLNQQFTNVDDKQLKVQEEIAREQKRTTEAINRLAKAGVLAFGV